MYSNRLRSLPPYLFAEIDQAKEKKISEGVDVIDFGVGDPDLPTPEHIVDRLDEAARNKENQGYPSYRGKEEFREAVSEWYKSNFNVDLDVEEEVISLIGSKEGIAHTPLAFVDPGEKTLVPDPSYPVYEIGTVLADGDPVSMPLKKENGFKPNLDKINRETAEEAKLMFLNYPNNPTAAVATGKYFKKVVDFAKKYDIIVCHDAAYSQITYDFDAPSFLEVDGAKDVGVEFHSLSKTYNMTGWRIGFAVGNKDVLDGIGKVKTNVDSGVFQAIQEAAIEALSGSQDCVKENVKTYKERRDLLVEGIKSLGLDVEKPKATFYIWAEVPEGTDSMSFSKKLLEEGGIVATPGSGFGEYGEGYLRFALTKDLDRIEEAVERMEEIEFE
ncbi:MAG: Diaminopimelate aminotransferase [Candidatus Methanohalarchaeum thermophilum]|uniref:Aminotransferase n=1 Tax=Methanohalarchaeum thermophilum TaxID=1903181 RepID=A0A1Q6DU25_METT1|nr:MAG: Diaminopimelate aminotransferase [Candidatus Methanohalarchaeum thermophilum]